MNKISVLVTLTMFISSFPAFAAPPVFCPTQAIMKEKLAALLERRKTTFKHCLSCDGKACQLKQWPAEGAQFAKQCKVLFCTPTRMPKSTFVPEDVVDGEFSFTYSIGKNGRVKDIKLTKITGELKEKSALKLARNSYKGRRYAPVVQDGVAYEVTNLSASMKLNVEMSITSNR